MRIALGQYDTGWQDTHGSLERAVALTRLAAAEGADLIVLPEMCATGFTMDPEHWAEPLDGPSAARLAEAARDARIHLVAGLATARGGRFYNSAIVFDSEGQVISLYDKRRLFAYANEAAHYSPGDRGVVFEVRGVWLSALVCYDLRFPELFREVGPDVDAFLVLANWPSSRHGHWVALLSARAIENQTYVIGVNRSGTGGGLEYAGGSVAYSPWGDRLVSETRRIAVVEIDSAEVTRIRSQYPFNPDRRGRVVGTAGAVGPSRPVTDGIS